MSDEDGDFKGNGSYNEEPLGRNGEVDGSIKSKALVPSQSRRPKRPDQALYVPRAARVRRSLQSSTANEDSQSSSHCSSNSLSCAPDSSSCPETTELKTQQSCAKVKVENKTNNCANSSGSCFQDETQKLSLSLYGNEAVVWNETQSLYAEMSLAGDEREDQTCPSDKVQIEDTSTDDVSELVSYRSSCLWLILHRRCIFISPHSINIFM